MSRKEVNPCETIKDKKASLGKGKAQRNNQKCINSDVGLNDHKGSKFKLGIKRFQKRSFNFGAQEVSGKQG